MGLLDAIWIVSSVLAVTSIAVMCVLIVRRLFTQAAAARYDKRRSELEQWFFKALDDAEARGGASLSKQDRIILSEIAYDLSTSVEGGMLADIEKLLAELGVADTLLECLADRNPKTRKMALNGLSLFETRQSFDAIWQLLTDPDANVRLLAARDIVASRFPFDAKTFIETLELGTVVRTREVRPIVVELAGRDPHGVLRAIAATDNPERRVFLIYGLGRSGRYEMVDDIVELTRSDNINERTESLRALSALQHPAAADAVHRALDDPAWEVRAQAAQAVAQIGLPDARHKLEMLLDDGMWWVRYRAAQSLWLLGSEARERLMAHAHETGSAGVVAQLVIAEQEDLAA